MIVIGVFGAALLYGDGVITPAISVLSATEGLRKRRGFENTRVSGSSRFSRFFSDLCMWVTTARCCCRSRNLIARDRQRIG